jgi:hypothetical protein
VNAVYACLEAEHGSNSSDCRRGIHRSRYRYEHTVRDLESQPRGREPSLEANPLLRIVQADKKRLLMPESPYVVNISDEV